MSNEPQRPIALTVLPENIPAELKSLMTWCCWRYEWNGKKWTKVPYTPFTTSHAMANKVSTLRSFQSAYNCYLERRDFFDGLYLCFTKDDPFAAGDYDHSTDLSCVPSTYTEISPSGNGVRFIGYGRVPRSCKKGDRELYRHNHFLSITGHRVNGLPTSPQPIQPELDVLYAEIGTKNIKDGEAGSKDRGAIFKRIPAEDWETGRQMMRGKGQNRLLARLRASAISKKTRKPDTQLAYLLKEDYTGFHHKWPDAGIVKGDGSVDMSQVRAVFASSIRIRRFSFPEYVVLMSHFFAHEYFQKAHTKQGWREELAVLWFHGRAPREGEYTAPIVEPVPRGRASDHQDLLDRAYQALVSFKAGTEALLTIQDLAEALNTHRRTAGSLLHELTKAGRVVYRIAHQNSGIVVGFPQGGVIYSTNENGNTEHSERLNGHKPDEQMTAKNETGVIIDENSMGVLSHPNAENRTNVQEAITADDDALVYIYKSSTVYLPDVAITPQKRIRNRVNLDVAVAEALDNLPRDRVLATGEMKKWPITIKRVREYLAEHYADCAWPGAAIDDWYDRIRARRRGATFRELEGLKREELEKRHATARKKIERAERKAKEFEHDAAGRGAWYGNLAARMQGQLGLLGYELVRRESVNDARIATHGYSQTEQQEMLDLVEESRRDTAGLVERLRAAKLRRQNE